MCLTGFSLCPPGVLECRCCSKQDVCLHFNPSLIVTEDFFGSDPTPILFSTFRYSKPERQSQAWAPPWPVIARAPLSRPLLQTPESWRENAHEALEGEYWVLYELTQARPLILRDSKTDTERDQLEDVERQKGWNKNDKWSWSTAAIFESSFITLVWKCSGGILTFFFPFIFCPTFGLLMENLVLSDTVHNSYWVLSEKNTCKRFKTNPR